MSKYVNDVARFKEEVDQLVLKINTVFMTFQRDTKDINPVQKNIIVGRAINFWTELVHRELDKKIRYLELEQLKERGE